MSTFAICPRCNQLLQAEEGQRLVCPAGHGVFSSGQSDSALAGEGIAPSLAMEAFGKVGGETDSTRCPGCLTVMSPVADGAIEMPGLQWECGGCGSMWSDAAIVSTDVDANVSAGTLHATADPSIPAAQLPAASAGLIANMLYGLSLPERLLRGAVGLTAGTARELAGFLVPQAFQDSSSYRIAIENSLGFLTETIGGVPRRAGSGDDSADEAGEHLARKAVGNFVDLAGLATLHVSPMWLLAVVSDVAYGTGTYARELAQELEAQGVIDNAATIHNVDDILAAVQRTCGTAAGTFDKPPLSIEELRKTIHDTRESLAEADVRKLIPESELREYWCQMQAVAHQEQVSLLGVSGAIAMQTLERVKTVGQGTMIGLHVAGGLL
ncbi:MAG: hypothetical protein KDA75_20575, partial [Planctomycetaceae bacterium]|nr:hypothetical protein [Planctomycetaceae bacterium]